MVKNLVIVEFFVKVKIIEKFLGKEFKVILSFGYIVDFFFKELGVDVEGDFIFKYIVFWDKKVFVKELKGLVDKVEMVWLVSDEDWEGEVIVWYLVEFLDFEDEKIKWIVFYEIIKFVIFKVIENFRKIDYNFVNV